MHAQANQPDTRVDSRNSTPPSLPPSPGLSPCLLARLLLTIRSVPRCGADTRPVSAGHVSVLSIGLSMCVVFVSKVVFSCAYERDRVRDRVRDRHRDSAKHVTGFQPSPLFLFAPLSPLAAALSLTRPLIPKAPFIIYSVDSPLCAIPISVVSSAGRQSVVPAGLLPLRLCSVCLSPSFPSLARLPWTQRHDGAYWTRSCTFFVLSRV